MGPAEPEALSARQRRAVAWMAVAAIVIFAAGFAYVRASPVATLPFESPTAVNPLEVTSDLVRYDFVSAMVAWAIDFPQNRPGFGAGQFWVSRTIDGGRHWQVRLSGRNEFSGLSGFTPYSIQFFDGEHGFVFLKGLPNQFYRTSDGGANWSSISLPDPDVTEVSFGDRSHGLLLVRSAGSQPVHLFATVDAGDRWQRMPDPPIAAYVLALRGSEEAWLASFGPAPARVYGSSDAGYSWRAHDLLFPPGMAFPPGGQWSTSVTLLPGHGVVASASCECAPTVDFKFATFDGGSTWRSVPGEPGPVAYQDDRNWWVVDARTLYRSADAGQTWNKISDQLPDWEFGPFALDMKHAWARLSLTGGSGLGRTDDAGMHWTRLSVPQPP